MATLSNEEITTALADLPGWEFDGSHIRKEFVFKGFRAAISFIVRIAFDAEAADHHPDLENHYNKVVVAFRTWDQEGITDLNYDWTGKAKSIDLTHRVTQRAEVFAASSIDLTRRAEVSAASIVATPEPPTFTLLLLASALAGVITCLWKRS
jgi:4a-hydroxytetrahydrobiopterin dehydratase